MADTMHQVSFVDVKESYPLGSLIQCRYVIKEPLTHSSKDWIGIYRVGWRSYDNYETLGPAMTTTKVWAQLSVGDGGEGEMDCNGIVTFPADSLPKDLKDFYQFCYVSSANQICGVSAPFQFGTFMDELVEVQDPDDPTTMVVKTRSQILEEQVTALKKERIESQKETQLLHLELDAERKSKGQLLTQLQKLSELQDQLDQERNSTRILNEQIKELQDTLQAERKSNEQLHQQIRGMRDELVTERKALQDSQSQQLEENFDQEIQAATRIKAETALHESDVINTSLRISNADEGDDKEEAAAAALSSVSASAEDDADAKQLSFTERITGSVLNHFKRASDWFTEDLENDPAQGTESQQSAATDKEEQSLLLCPICNMNFVDISEQDIATHVDGHNGLSCPICYMQFDKGYEESKVTAHVNSHLDE